MCGIAGVWSPDLAVAPGRVGEQMGRQLVQRGPDAGGFESLLDGRLVLAHRRLSIQDLSAEGAQPMRSRCGRYLIAFNGEIYNHWDVRRLIGTEVRWRGHSDTETLVEAISTWGVERTLPQLVGMFAFAVWDAHARVLTLARDRIGEKPLYWGAKEGTFFFTSDLRAILRSDLAPFAVDRRGVQALLSLGYIPDPLSILSGVSKLEPGGFATVQENRGTFAIRADRYWLLEEAVANARRSPQVTNRTEWVDRVEEDLTAAVKRQLIADVPVGAFLSGGVDSSLIAAMMAEVCPEPIRTFTIAMPGDWNEAPRARRMADYLGSIHTEIPISERGCMEVIPKLAKVYSEPFGDSSQVPTYLVAEAARRHVTVALSGDGGDEFFGGYNRHVAGRRIWNVLGRIPAGVRSVGAGVSDRGAAGPVGVMLGRVASLGGGGLRRKLMVEKGMRLIGATSEADFYERMVMQWPLAQAPTKGGTDWRFDLPRWVEQIEGLDPAERFMAYDIETSLPGDMLTKVDRATMAHGLEARVPFLDPDLIQTALSVPIHLKLDGRQGKLVLRELLVRRAPKGWTEEPEGKKKKGFGIPVARWLRQDLRDWAESLISDEVLRDSAFLDANLVRRRWNEFLAGHEWGMPLFTLLLFQAWYAEYRDALLTS